MKTIENNKTFQSNIFSTDNSFEESMKQSFEYWHKKYMNSPLNYPLVWKNILISNFEMMKKIKQIREKNTKQTTSIRIQQFFEMWAYSIRNSNFEMAKKSMQDWDEFWKNTTNEEVKIYMDVLQMIQRHWKEIQSKNIE
jgi:hypothetical protein